MTASTGQLPPPQPREIQLERLADMLPRVFSALLEKGLGPERTLHAFSTALSADCLQCQITLPGAELVKIAAPEGWVSDSPESSAGTPKLARLLQGYCARNGCDSHYYSVSFTETDGVNWDQIWRNAVQAQSERNVPVENTGAGSLAQSLVSQYGLRKISVTAALAVVGLALIYWQFRTPSWSTRPSGFQVDPASFQIDY